MEAAPRVSEVRCGLEVVSPYRDPQPEVSKNDIHVYNLNENICESIKFNANFFYNVFCLKTTKRLKTTVDVITAVQDGPHAESIKWLIHGLYRNISAL